MGKMLEQTFHKGRYSNGRQTHRDAQHYLTSGKYKFKLQGYHYIPTKVEKSDKFWWELRTTELLHISLGI